jgi:5-(carboxyamino)imidazole ribonucleotide synthase
VNVGVLGGGQLGRMLALAGHRLGMRCTFLDPAPDACAGAVGALITAAYDDAAALDALARASDVVTYEFESVPAAAAARLAERVPVLPPPRALATAGDRLAEKRLFERLAIPTAAFLEAGTAEAAADAAERLGGACLVKTRRLGYDGKGQAPAAGGEAAAAAWEALGGAPAIVERRVAFRRELSLVAVRGGDGAFTAYPLVENRHVDGILRATIAPAPGVPAALQAAAEGAVAAIADALAYVGVLALELFETDCGMLANELAPRVHNSGHWTIDAARTSQFENHLRALARLPLGDPAAVEASVMVNLIGDVPPLARLLAVPGACVHVYGKAPRPGRKVGHVTVTGRDPDAVQHAAVEVARLAGDGTGALLRTDAGVAIGR